jgi:hypothetical protein
LLGDHPDLQPCLKSCRHCGILFFTDPRNACRADLRCGFGCREAHRRFDSARRSASYYRDHPDKKQRQNRKRYLHSVRSHRSAVMEPHSETPPPIVRHVRVIVSLVERRSVGIDEVLAMLRKKRRQHSMVKRRRRPYIGRRIDGKGS